MDRKAVSKISTMGFMGAGIITWLSVGVLFEASARLFGSVQKLYGNELIKHGVTVGSALLIFAILQLNPKVNVWAEEVISEVSKVSWPSRRDSVGMTIVVIVMVLIASVILFLFDNLARFVLGLVIG